MIEKPECGSVRATARVRLAPHLSCAVFEAHLRAIPAVRSAVYVIAGAARMVADC